MNRILRFESVCYAVEHSKRAVTEVFKRFIERDKLFFYFYPSKNERKQQRE